MLTHATESFKPTHKQSTSTSPATSTPTPNNSSTATSPHFNYRSLFTGSRYESASPTSPSSYAQQTPHSTPYPPFYSQLYSSAPTSADQYQQSQQASRRASMGDSAQRRDNSIDASRRTSVDQLSRRTDVGYGNNQYRTGGHYRPGELSHQSSLMPDIQSQKGYNQYPTVQHSQGQNQYNVNSSIKNPMRSPSYSHPPGSTHHLPSMQHHVMIQPAPPKPSPPPLQFTSQASNPRLIRPAPPPPKLREFAELNRLLPPQQSVQTNAAPALPRAIAPAPTGVENDGRCGSSDNISGQPSPNAQQTGSVQQNESSVLQSGNGQGGNVNGPLTPQDAAQQNEIPRKRAFAWMPTITEEAGHKKYKQAPPPEPPRPINVNGNDIRRVKSPTITSPRTPTHKPIPPHSHSMQQTEMQMSGKDNVDAEEIAKKEQETIMILQSLINNKRLNGEITVSEPISSSSTPVPMDIDRSVRHNPEQATAPDDTGNSTTVPKRSSSTSSLGKKDLVPAKDDPPGEILVTSQREVLQEAEPSTIKDLGASAGDESDDLAMDDCSDDEVNSENGADDDKNNNNNDNNDTNKTNIDKNSYPPSPVRKMTIDSSLGWNSDELETEDEVEEEIVIQFPMLIYNSASSSGIVTEGKPLVSSPKECAFSLENGSLGIDSKDCESGERSGANEETLPPTRKSSNATIISLSRKGSNSSSASTDSKPHEPVMSPTVRRKSTLKDSSDEKLELDKIEWEKNIDLPSYIWAETICLFEQVKQFKEMKNRQPHRKKNHILASLLYILCRQHGLPRTFMEICSAAGIRKQEIGTYYRLMNKLLSNNGLSVGANGPNKMVDSAEFLKRWCQHLRLQSHILDAAIHVYKQANTQNITTGKCPLSVGAAAIWLSVNSWNEARTQHWNRSHEDDEYIRLEQKDVAQVAGVVNATLNSCYKTLSQVKDNLLPPEFLEKAKKLPNRRQPAVESKNGSDNRRGSSESGDETVEIKEESVEVKVEVDSLEESFRKSTIRNKKIEVEEKRLHHRKLKG
ncbi:44_t:CDS:2 [Paraglomus brasilianum]|uniref:44_t:CDS:1 n=1 Tax=Paraglomus brasilianum TaxID=144538 RepID=A0A9N8ZKR8_9GLOM|nr:44_t:CDS:2 [Paraglomus brasilianum]